MKDGFVLMYVKDGTIYPVGMSGEELKILQLMAPAMFKDKKVTVINHPLGQAVNLVDELRKEEEE